MKTTIKSESLLQIGLNELQAAEAAERIASETFHASNLWADRSAWLAAWNRLDKLRKLYQQGESLLLSKGF